MRLYSIIIYYLFKNAIKPQTEVSLNICKDFDGREGDIRNNLIYFLEKNLKLNIHGRYYFTRLDKESNAHKYAYLMRRDGKNRMETYVKITLEDIEKFLGKKE